MSVINLANCNSSTNIGLSECVTNRGIFRWAIAVPKGTSITAATASSNSAFNTAITALFTANSRSTRAYLLPSFTAVTDNTGDAVTEAQGNFDFVVASKPYNWSYRMNTDDCTYKNVYNLLRLKQSQFDIIFVDDNGNVYGTLVNGTDFGGIPMAQIFTPDPTQKTDSANPMYMINFLLQNNQDVIVNSAVVASNFRPNPATMGLLDVILTEGTVGTTSATVLYVKGNFACGGGNIGDAYGTTLNAGAAWSVVPAAGGSAIVPSGVTYSSTTGEYALTIASTPATDLIVGLANPSVLTATPYFVYAITETANKVTITTP
jgi:hypothetical protein